MKHIFIIQLLSILIISNKCFSQDDFPIIKGPYLGQEPPGLIPEVFAPGIITTEYYEFGGVFAPDMNEFYFVRMGGKFEKYTFVVNQFKNNRWTESVVSPYVGEPFISTDGNTMYLGNKYVERIDSGWSEVKSLESPFKDISIMRLSVSSEGTYYFDTRAKDVPIRYSRLIEGKHEEPKDLGKEINTGTFLAHPFIAPDETYLIWDCVRENGYGDSDLYISFRNKDGSWGTAINMGDKINTELEEGFASVTPDAKYLFFNRFPGPGKADIYWVDAQIIETLKLKK